MNKAIMPKWTIMKLPAIAALRENVWSPFTNPMHHFLHQAHISRANDIFDRAREDHPALAEMYPDPNDFLQAIPDNGGMLAEFRLLKQLNKESALLGMIEQIPPFWRCDEYTKAVGYSVLKNKLNINETAELGDRIRAAAYLGDILDQTLMPFEIEDASAGRSREHYLLLKEDWIEPLALDYLKYLGRSYSDHAIKAMMPEYTEYLVKEQGMAPAAAMMQARQMIETYILEPVAMCVEGLSALDRGNRDDELKKKFEVRRFIYDPTSMPALDKIYEGLEEGIKDFMRNREGGKTSRLVRWHPDSNPNDITLLEISPRNPFLYQGLLKDMGGHSLEMRTVKQLRQEMQDAKLEKAELAHQLVDWQQKMTVVQRKYEILEREYDRLLADFKASTSDMADMYAKAVDLVTGPR